MRCGAVVRRLSAYRDGDLPREQAHALASHLDACPRCAARWRSLSAALEALAGAPRLRSAEPIAPRLLTRLEVETRGPGLALLFRPVWKARPLIWPSLLPAALVLTMVVAAAMVLDDGGPLPEVATASSLSAWDDAGAWGTEANPLFAVAGVSVRRARGAPVLPPAALEAFGEGTLFVETVVGRDGSVTAVNLLQGDLERARDLLEALRHERFEPARFRGRAVAVSLYRLISGMEVRARIT